MTACLGCFVKPFCKINNLRLLFFWIYIWTCEERTLVAAEIYMSFINNIIINQIILHGSSNILISIIELAFKLEDVSRPSVIIIQTVLEVLLDEFFLANTVS